MALRLPNRGISRIRPLAGGLNAWRASGFALQPLEIGETDLISLGPQSDLAAGTSAVPAEE